MPKLEHLTMFESIASVRPDGAQMTARRVVSDAKTPIHWTITMKDKLGQFIFNELPIFEETNGRAFKQYLTHELSMLAQSAGFTDWQLLPIAQVEGYELVSGEYRKRLMWQYQQPDLTNYPLE
ncbi:MAG: hypothetical protein ACXVCM_16930 [Ktedonobacteraceae bacterium]